MYKSFLWKSIIDPLHIKSQQVYRRNGLESGETNKKNIEETERSYEIEQKLQNIQLLMPKFSKTET